MWGFNNKIAETLKQFAGEITPNSQEYRYLKDKRRWYLTELPKERVQCLLDFFDKHKFLIVGDVLKGRGMLSAEWFLVTRLNPDGSKNWTLRNINEVINFYAQGDVRINENGNLIIGKLTAQRKGDPPIPLLYSLKLNH